MNKLLKKSLFLTILLTPFSSFNYEKENSTINKKIINTENVKLKSQIKEKPLSSRIKIKRKISSFFKKTIKPIANFSYKYIIKPLLIYFACFINIAFFTFIPLPNNFLLLLLPTAYLITDNKKNKKIILYSWLSISFFVLTPYIPIFMLNPI